MEGITTNKGIVSGTASAAAASPQSPKPVQKEKTLADTYEEELKKQDGLDQPYKELKKVVIALASDITIGSSYRQVNARSIPDRHDSVGGSIMSGRTLIANHAEMSKYMPSLIGVSPNDPAFTRKVSNWFCNISIPVPADGFALNCNFNWDRKEDYLRFAIKEQSIIDAYDNASKSNAKEIREAITTYVRDLNELESTRYLHGSPENIDHYMSYRHCLLYSHVAKDPLVVYFDGSVRFYIKDEQRENNRMKRMRIQATKAKRNYLDCIDDRAKFKAVFVCYCAMNKLDVMTNLSLDEAIQERMLDDFSIKEPEKFNKLYNNNNLSIQAFIEEAIAKGELVRSEVNQTVLTPEGAFIGSNMKEAIAYFNNPENKEYRKALETKIKL